MKKTLFTSAALLTCVFSFAQNVGIGTTTPKARLHVADSAVVFTAPNNLPATPPPVEGAGVRMLWYPQFAAFRAGEVTGTQWDQVNTGFSSFATGYNTKAVGPNSIAMGNGSEAQGYSSIAIGEICIANGENVVSIGAYNNVTGDNSAAFGESNTVSGEHSLALGSGNTATGDYSTAIGDNTKSKAVNGVTLGTYNDQTDVPTATAAATDRLFQLGNGTATTKSNAITVLRNGNTGFGTVNPAQKIDINKGRIRFSGDVDAGTAQGIEFTNATGSTLNGFIGRYNDSMIGFYGFTGAGWKMLYNNTNGNLGLQGNVNPKAPLSFSNDAGNKISIYDNGDGTHYGIGLQAAKMQFYTPSSTQDIVFGTGSSIAFTENMRIKGNGNVGIGNTSPGEKLDVFGNATISGKITSASLKVTGSTPHVGDVLTSTSTSGDAVWQAPSSNNSGFHTSYIGLNPLTINTWTLVELADNNSTEDFDEGLRFNNITHAYSVSKAGVYQFNLDGKFSYSGIINAVYTNKIRLKKNGTSIQETSGILYSGASFPQNVISISVTLKLEVGDVLIIEGQSDLQGARLSSIFSGFRVY